MRSHFTARTFPELVTLYQNEGGGTAHFKPRSLYISRGLAFDLNKSLLHQFLIAYIGICINTEANKLSTFRSYAKYLWQRKKEN